MLQTLENIPVSTREAYDADYYAWVMSRPRGYMSCDVPAIASVRHDGEYSIYDVEHSLIWAGTGNSKPYRTWHYTSWDAPDGEQWTVWEHNGAMMRYQSKGGLECRLKSKGYKS